MENAFPDPAGASGPSPREGSGPTLHSDGGSRQFRLRHFLRLWALFTGILFLLFLVWSLATPIPSGPDEPTQYVRAAAVARGTLTGTRFPHEPSVDPSVAVRVPGTITRLYSPSIACYYSHPNVPAGCARFGPATHALVPSSTYLGYYPPLYYLLTGWPTLLSTSAWSLHVVRAVSGLIQAALFGLAFVLIITWSRTRWLLVGLTVSLTPMAFYLASVLNPNGLEVALCAVVAVSTTLLVYQYSKSPPLSLVISWGAAAALLCFVRPLSPAYLAAILVFVVALRPQQGRDLLENKRVRVAALAVLLAALLATIYVVAERSYRQEHFPLPPGLSNLEVLRLLLGNLPSSARQIVGAFGTPAIYAPALAFVLCVVAVVFLLGTGMLLARRRDAILLAAYTVLVFVVLPVAATFPSARSNGILWQGRYTYPLAISLPIIAAALLAEKRLPLGRVAVAAVVSMTVASAVSFYWVLRTYTVGIDGPLNPSAKVPHGWPPPIPANLLIVFMILLTAALGVAILAAMRPHRLGAHGPGRSHLPTVESQAAPSQTLNASKAPSTDATLRLWAHRSVRGLSGDQGDGRDRA